MSKTKDVVNCLRRVHRAIVRLQPGPADPLTAVLRDVEDTLANPAIVDVIERRARRAHLHEQVRRSHEDRVPTEVSPALSLLMLGAIDAEPLPELGQGDLRARQAAALWFAARQLRATGEAGTESSAILLGQLADELENKPSPFNAEIVHPGEKP